MDQDAVGAQLAKAHAPHTYAAACMPSVAYSETGHLLSELVCHPLCLVHVRSPQPQPCKACCAKPSACSAPPHQIRCQRRCLCSGDSWPRVPCPLRSCQSCSAFRTQVQRKHRLRTLAVEADHASREAYRPTLNHSAERERDPFAILEHRYAHLHLWFSNKAQALAFPAIHGGKAVSVGTQAVVLPAMQSDRHDTQGA